MPRHLPPLAKTARGYDKVAEVVDTNAKAPSPPGYDCAGGYDKAG